MFTKYISNAEEGVNKSLVNNCSTYTIRNHGAIKANPHNPDGYYILGNALATAGKYNEAYRAFSKGVQVCPHSQSCKSGMLEMSRLLKLLQDDKSLAPKANSASRRGLFGGGKRSESAYSRNVQNLAEYWERQTRDTKHSPYKFLAIDNQTIALFEEILDHTSLTDSFLEVGCNAGRNLDYLYLQGYRNLSGIEISPFAIDVFRETFPRSFASSTIYIGDAISELMKIPDQSIDIVFTCTVLTIIKNHENLLFSELTRVSKKFIFLLEMLPTPAFNAPFHHEYEKIFPQLGFVLVCKKNYYGTLTGIKQYPDSDFPKFNYFDPDKYKHQPTYSMMIFVRNKETLE